MARLGRAPTEEEESTFARAVVRHPLAPPVERIVRAWDNYLVALGEGYVPDVIEAAHVAYSAHHRQAIAAEGSSRVAHIDTFMDPHGRLWGRWINQEMRYRGVRVPAPRAAHAPVGAKAATSPSDAAPVGGFRVWTHPLRGRPAAWMGTGPCLEPGGVRVFGDGDKPLDEDNASEQEALRAVAAMSALAGGSV